MKTIQQAAQARSAGLGSLTARPTLYRAADGHPADVSAELFQRSYTSQINLREPGDGSGLTFDGIASATEKPYEMWDFWGPYTEIVSAGAFATTLSRPDLDVPLVLGHDQLRRIASTTNGTLALTEEDEGLRAVADLDPADADVAYIVPKLRAGLIREMSFAFRIVRGMWSPDYTEYRIEEIDLHRGDTSIVGFGANPFTSGGLRSAGDLRELLRNAPDDEARSVLGELLKRFPGKRSRKPQEVLLPHI